ncbi:MAG: hypothetical protein EX286_04110 [Candidatus Nitrosopelagicus brevis]|nr:hypothetical protein [Candidatus Nitrosopelagicus brevis]
MNKFVIVFLGFLMVSSLTPLSFGERLGPADAPLGVLRDFVISIKFLDAYFGTEGNKIEVAPGDKNVPFTVIMSNVGTQDITGIKGKLSLPAAYQSPSGRGVAMMADNDQKASAGNTFALTFFVDVSDKAPIKDYSGTIDLTFSRLRESGERSENFAFTFKLTGDSIVNLRPISGALTSITNNDVVIEISNAGSAPLNNVDIVLQNDQTSVASTSSSVTNLENVIFDQTHWDVGTIPPQSSVTFSLKVFVPETVKNEPLHLPMTISYYDAHGELETVTRVTDFYINGLVDPSIYGVKVIDLSGKQTVIGEILNEGNSDGLFGFVTLKPRGDSNIKESTQYIDEIEPDSPVPFNIPIDFEGVSLTGEHDITIEVRYKDSMREEHILSYDTTIDVSTLSLLDTEEGDSPMGAIAAVVIIGAIIGILYKKGKLPMMSKKSQ